MKIKKSQVQGIILVLILSAISQGLAKFLPQVGAEGIAMILGILLGNLIFTNDSYAAGVKWSEKYPIEIGIALLGSTLTFKTIGQLGFQGVFFILVNMALVIGTVFLLGRYVFHVSLKESMLMGAGNAVCGSSAIAAVAPSIKAKDDDRRTAVATVSLTGMLLLLTLPALSQALFGGNNLLKGALVGGTVQSVGQVVGTAALINPNVVTFATLFKLLRVMLLVVVVLSFATIAKKSAEKAGEKSDEKTKIILLPWYLIAFVLLLVLNSLVTLPNAIHELAHQLSSFFGVVNLAAIGLNLKWSVIRKSGVKFLSFGFFVGLAQVVLAVLLIKIFF
ncbi:putative sulfate exporter family transporter [Fructobacillus sp. M1-13]|uniref:Sulfate exporter family transporter n=1 Tax=Fructobacillus papyriferae TaxID=2713171 RepID=A0ABS5QNK1_9LACO|nr:putative sulfate exporter family transporter [Fructobacillus papyriferae]MBS9334699.1 putative sulfate exporter family transporter [Fructobacillus papyriferae]MCD2158689.1 putative sulfate exporter family transporter [Fructobacillus papyriferae]